MSETLTLAVIPARGGSKRIPRKNIRPFLGVPLVARPIRTLVESGLFDRIVVSTDDDEIATVAEQAGAWVPFRRPAELADDHTPTVPVIVDAIERVECLTESQVGEVLVVYPAAVFMTREHLVAARKMLRTTGVDIVMSAAEFPAPILRAWRNAPGGYAEMIWPEHKLTRSQDLEPTYYDAGQFYWWAPRAHRGADTSNTFRTGLFKLPESEVQDIDTDEDWRAAEAKFASKYVSQPTASQTGSTR